MLFSSRRILGAALAATMSSTSFVLSEPALQSDETQTAHITDLIARAKKRTYEITGGLDSRSSRPPTDWSSKTEEDRARAVLDRYYSMSVEAQSANAPPRSAEETKIKQGAGKKRAQKRKPARDVFEDLDLSTVDGPFCKKYVICGGGTAAWAAIEAILEADHTNARDVLLITNEEHFPYNRTVLSKELWEEAERQLVNTDEQAHKAVEYEYRFAKQEKVSAIRAKRVTHLDTDEKSVSMSDGCKVHYDKLLLATGGFPRDAGNVSQSLKSPDLRNNVAVFRTLDDFQDLRKSVEQESGGVIIVGGGFLGTELAIALTSLSDKISLVVAEAGVLYRVLPRYMCEYLARRLTEIGINVVRSAVINNADKKEGDEKLVQLDITSPDAKKVEGRKVIVAVGIEPEAGLARGAGLELDTINGGIRVNDFMTVEPDIFAAGDVASFHDRSLGRRRVEHWDHAVVTGRIAGKNMIGNKERYGLQSMFWSDLTNIGASFTAVGLVDSSLETISVWNTASQPIDGAPSANDYESGVIYYVKNSEVVGVLLWNAKKGSGALRRARALISAKTKLNEISEPSLGALVNVADAPFRTIIRTKAR